MAFADIQLRDLGVGELSEGFGADKGSIAWRGYEKLGFSLSLVHSDTPVKATRIDIGEAVAELSGKADVKKLVDSALNATSHFFPSFGVKSFFDVLGFEDAVRDHVGIQSLTLIEGGVSYRRFQTACGKFDSANGFVDVFYGIGIVERLFFRLKTSDAALNVLVEVADFLIRNTWQSLRRT